MDRPLSWSEEPTNEEMLALRLYKAAAKEGVPLIVKTALSAIYVQHATLSRELNDVEWSLIDSWIANEGRKLGVSVRVSSLGTYRLSA